MVNHLDCVQFLVYNTHVMAWWLSWLERRPVTAEVVGSSPIRVVSNNFIFIRHYGILAQLGEHLPYKQRVTGSSPVGPIFYVKYADMAQLAEQLICNQQVNGSSPFIGFDFLFSRESEWMDSRVAKGDRL